MTRWGAVVPGDPEQTRLSYPRSVHSLGRPQLGLLLMAWVAVLTACGGKSDSGDTDAPGGSGASSGGTVTGGTSGSGSGGMSGTGGAPTCVNVHTGKLCIRGRPDGENERIVVGDRLRIEVTPEGCYSSSCTEVVVETCSVARVGYNFTASPEFCLGFTADPNVGCTDDCGGANDALAHCESDEGLEAGNYMLTFGELAFSFTVPGTISISEACASSSF